MSDEHDNDQVRAAFDRLRHDAHEVDTMAARRQLEGNSRLGRLGLGVLGAAAAAILIIVGIVVWNGDDDPTETVSTGQPTPEPGDGVPGPGTLDGTAWTLTAGFGDEGEIPIVDGWPITLGFDGDNLGGTAACNGYGGAFTLDGDAVVINEIAQTEMACDGRGVGDVMASETLFLRALISVDRLLIDGDQLTMTGPSTELVFGLDTPVPAAELVGQLWLLDTIIQGETASSVQGDPATLLLSDNGTLEGGTGCRTFSGEYVIAGASVQFTSFGMNGVCSAQLRAQDDQVVTVLGDGFTVEIDGDRLTLTSQGNESLGYTAIDEVPDFEPTPSITVEALDGTSWVLVEGVGPDGEIIVGQNPISISFDGDSLRGQASCNTYGASFALVGSTLDLSEVEHTEEGCEELDIEERFFDGLRGANRIELFGTEVGARELVLTGPDTDILFAESATTPGDNGQGGDEAISVSALLDAPPPVGAAVDVSGHLFYRGGSWILCENVDTDFEPFCAGRWVVITNYNAVVNPHTEPPTSVAEAAFGMADGNRGFTRAGDVVYTPEPQVVTLSLLTDRRASVPEWPSGAELTEAEQQLLSAFTALSADVPVDPNALRLDDAVLIGLSDQLVDTRTAAELADPANWELDLEAFRGRVGPYSALELLGSVAEVSWLVGPHDHCAAPPAPVPDGLEDARHLSIQPEGIDSCLEWFTVDIFVDPDGNVIGITLDLWEP